MKIFDLLVKIAIFGAFLFRSRDSRNALLPENNARLKNFHKSKSNFYEKLSTRACRFYDLMHFKQFHFFKRDLQKGQNSYKKMHDLGIIQNVQQYPKLLCISWRNCS